jgi:hypothetical protein
LHAFNPWRHLVGKPYRQPPTPPTTFDCYTLVVWVRELCYGTKTPLLCDPAFVSRDNMEQLLELHQQRDIYIRVAQPEPADIMVFDPHHIGVVVENGVLSAVAEPAQQVLYFDWRKMARFFPTAHAVRLV